jgi:hypothetical protein
MLIVGKVKKTFYFATLGGIFLQKKSQKRRMLRIMLE